MTSLPSLLWLPCVELPGTKCADRSWARRAMLGLAVLSLTCSSAHGAVLVDNVAGGVTVDGAQWLAPATSARFFCGRWYNLCPTTTGIIRSTGHDVLGPFTEIREEFRSGQAMVVLAVKDYGNDTYVFEQRLDVGCNDTQASEVPELPRVHVDDYNHPGMVPPFLSYPAWDSTSGLLRSLRFLTWQGGSHSTYQWTVQESHGIDITRPKKDGTFMGLAGLSAGPVVLMRPGTEIALVVGPLTHVKLATSVMARAGNTTWELGVSSETLSVPKAFVHRTLLTAAPGPTRAMLRWGKLARREAGLEKRVRDVATTKLGYFTDNGAMLYGDAWGHDLSCCNRSVLRSVLQKLETARVPVGWIQLDDWWYRGYSPSGGGVYCTMDWKPWPDAFPGGLDAVQTKLPWLLYAPYFCRNSSFGAMHPGEMLVSPGGYAVPRPGVSTQFYRNLFAMYAGRIAGYEVDFMIDNFLNQPFFRQQLGAAEAWLAGMHAAALEQEMSVQYCMALPSDLLASLHFPAVTNYRASDDYAGSSVTNFNLQTSSLLGYALALRPSKDVFFTTDNAPENPYIRRLNSRHPTVPGVDLELNALIATLSTGPVAIGDGPGRTDRELVMRSCRQDGLLLQPVKPVTAIDAHYDGREVPAGGLAAAGHAQIWTTYSELVLHRSGQVPSQFIYHTLLSIDVDGPFAVDPRRDFFPGFDTRSTAPGGSGHLYRWDYNRMKCANGTDAVASGCVLQSLPKIDDRVRPILPFDSHRWSLLHVLPELPGGWVFLGDCSKWVPTASKRFPSIRVTEGGLLVTVEGAVGERLELTAITPARRVEVIDVLCSGEEQSVCFGSCDVTVDVQPSNKSTPQSGQ